MKKLYDIYFQDGTNFEGGSIENTRWLEIPNKSIRKLVYYLPSKEKISLENYDSYYHYIECTSDLNGKNAGKINNDYAYLITKEEEWYEIMKINLKIGTMVTTVVTGTDSEEISKLNPIGWKKGGK
jgi:hypothetical protein